MKSSQTIKSQTNELSGSNLRNIVLEAGGPDDRQRQARMVRFPKAESEGNAIRIEAAQEIADKIVAQIEELVSQRDSQTTEIVEVPAEKHRLLIGRGGETRRQLESQFKVSLDIPRQTVTGPQRSQVKVAGLPSDVSKAREHIATLIKGQEEQTIQVPLKYHNIISDNGQLFRRLRNDHRVTVDHAGKQPPNKNVGGAPAPRRGGALPLITDDASAATDKFSWELHNLHSDAPDGEIPWALSGPSAEDVQKARARVEAALAEASKHDSVGYLFLPDPSAYRVIVGPGGSEINRIRKQTGCRITVPKQGEGGSEAVEITGSKDGCEDAKDIIMGLVGGGS